MSLKRVLIDGTILNILLTVILCGSIYVNPLIWAHDYPPDIQTVVGDAEIPPAQTIIVAVLFFGAIIEAYTAIPKEFVERSDDLSIRKP